MRVAESSQPMLIIDTIMGLFQYCWLPFGSSLWHRAMAQVLQVISGVAFINDILVTGQTREEHKATLCKVSRVVALEVIIFILSGRT